MVKEIRSEKLEDFTEEIKEGFVVVDMYATWCGPCKMMGPVFEDASNKIKDVEFIKFDIDAAKEIPLGMGVNSVPTIMIFKDGVELERKTGYIHNDQFIKWIEKVVS